MALTIEGPTPREEGMAANGEPQTMKLEGELSDIYIDRLDLAIRSARLNHLFPSERSLRTHLAFLGQRGSYRLYDSLFISLQNGLPTVREILRVKIDRDLAEEFLSAHWAQQAQRACVKTATNGGAERPLETGAIPEGNRMARRVAYYRALAESEVMPVSRLSIELRQQIPEQNRALFRVVFDRFDLATNQFARYTLLLGQRDRFWQQRHLIVDEEELAAPTEGFRNTITRFASHDAELAFVLLSRQESIEVEDVQRCRIGPLLLPGMKIGGPLEALLDPRTGLCAGGAPPWILCFPQDRAGLEVAEHSSKDPLAPLLRDAISEQARELVDQKADELGYRVAKSRKFVCPRALEAPLGELCKKLGTPSIIRGV